MPFGGCEAAVSPITEGLLIESYAIDLSAACVEVCGETDVIFFRMPSGEWAIIADQREIDHCLYSGRGERDRVRDCVRVCVCVCLGCGAAI